MKDILSLVEKEEVQDVFNIGYIDDDDEIKSFVPSLNFIFMEFKDGTYEFIENKLSILKLT